MCTSPKEPPAFLPSHKLLVGWLRAPDGLVLASPRRMFVTSFLDHAMLPIVFSIQQNFLHCPYLQNALQPFFHYILAYELCFSFFIIDASRKLLLHQKSTIFFSLMDYPCFTWCLPSVFLHSLFNHPPSVKSLTQALNTYQQVLQVNPISPHSSLVIFLTSVDRLSFSTDPSFLLICVGVP